MSALDAGDYHRAAFVRHAVVLSQPVLCRAGRLASCRRFGVVIFATHAWKSIEQRCPTMAKFRVKDTFAIEGRPHFVLAGSIVEGEVRAGMFVQVPLNSSTAMTARIDCIESVRRLGGHEDTCLCIRYAEPEELELWRGLDIGAETLNVTTDGSD